MSGPTARFGSTSSVVICPDLSFPLQVAIPYNHRGQIEMKLSLPYDPFQYVLFLERGLRLYKESLHLDHKDNEAVQQFNTKCHSTFVFPITRQQILKGRRDIYKLHHQRTGTLILPTFLSSSALILSSIMDLCLFFGFEH